MGQKGGTNMATNRVTRAVRVVLTANVDSPGDWTVDEVESSLRGWFQSADPQDMSGLRGTVVVEDVKVLPPRAAIWKSK